MSLFSRQMNGKQTVITDNREVWRAAGDSVRIVIVHLVAVTHKTLSPSSILYVYIKKQNKIHMRMHTSSPQLHKGGRAKKVVTHEHAHRVNQTLLPLVPLVLSAFLSSFCFPFFPLW